MDTTNPSDAVVAPPNPEGVESASSASEETELVAAKPPNQLKIDALRRLRALERRGKTVGTHLDELRALLTVLFNQLPD